MQHTLRKNIVANYIGLIYTSLIGIVMLPMYLKYLGGEAFGLVGFYTLLMSWLSLLVAGVSPTVVREIAYFRGLDQLWSTQFRQVFRSIELILIVLALIASSVVYFASGWLADSWLTVKTLRTNDVIYCIILMGITICFRWLSTFYSSLLSGMELQVWLNAFNSLFATLRYVAAYALLRWVSNDAKHFFDFQLVVAMLELLVVSYTFYRTRPKNDGSRNVAIGFSFGEMKRIAPFAGGIAYTSMLWVLMTQSDKLIFSHILSLSDYGHFALVVVVSNAILLLSTPVNQAVLPRMTKLFSEQNINAVLGLYRKSTQYLAVVLFSTAGVIACFSEQTLFVLTGNHAVSNWGASILAWFSLGNAVLVIVGLQSLLQYVYGKVRMHVLNTSINALVQVPVLVFIAFQYGPVAVAKAWFVIRIVTFIVWPPLVHQKLAPGLHSTWLKADILPPLAGALLTLAFVYFTFSEQIASVESRLILLLNLCIVGMITLMVSGLFAHNVRSDVAKKLESLKRA